MARLIDRPLLPPHRCFTCQHSAAENGPYLDTVAEAPTGERVIYCASCTATLVRALDVVPAAKLQEALAFRDLALQAEATACELAASAAAATERSDRLEGELAGARSENTSLRNTIREKEQAAARERRENLLADVVALRPEEPAAA